MLHSSWRPKKSVSPSLSPLSRDSPGKILEGSLEKKLLTSAVSHFLLQGIFLTVVGYSPWSYKESDTIEGLTLSLFHFPSAHHPTLVPGFAWARDSNTHCGPASLERRCVSILLEDSTRQCSPSPTLPAPASCLSPWAEGSSGAQVGLFC